MKERRHRLVRLWVRIFPAAFRTRYAEEIVEYWRLRSRQVREQRGWLGLLMFGCRAAVDIVRAAMLERRDARRVVTRQRSRPRRLASLTQDVGYALRGIRRSPGFTCAVVAVLALGIGANTAIFSVVRGVLLRPLPFPDPDRLVVLRQTQRSDGSLNDISFLNYADWEEQNAVFAEVAAMASEPVILSGTQTAERLSGLAVTHRFFEVLASPPALGRGFLPHEQGPGGERAAVLSHGVWQRRFGGDSSVVGTPVMLDGVSHTVVGIASPEFDYPAGTEVWIPTEVGHTDSCGRDCLQFRAIARLRPNVTMDRAALDMSLVASRLEVEFPVANAGVGASVVGLRDWLTAGVRRSLWLLLGAVGFVLLVACANVANLLLVRGAARRGELALRTALGASRGRVIAQLLTESVTLGLIGGVVGWGLAHGGVWAVRVLAPAGLPRIAEARIDLPVLIFAAVVSAGTGLVFGVLPALHLSRLDVSPVLKLSGRNMRSPVRGWTRDLLVVMQVTISLTLLVGAGLLIKSFARLGNVDPGFDPRGLVTARVALPGARYDTPEMRAAFFDKLIAALKATPGVLDAAATLVQPINDGDLISSFEIAGAPPRPPGSGFTVSIRSITPGYFEVAGIPVMNGRGFDARDGTDGSTPVIVNEVLARRHWPGQDPVGQRLRFGLALNGDDGVAPVREVVGVVGNVKIRGLDDRERSVAYIPYARNSYAAMTVVARMSRDSEAFGPAIRATVSGMDRELAVYAVRPMPEILAESMASPRFYMVAMAFFACVAVIMASVGIFGVVSYMVTARTRELGIRIALGAQSGRMTRNIMARGALLAGTGVAFGLGLAAWTSAMLQGLLFEVEPLDPGVLGFVAALIVFVVLAASYVPARQAGRVDAVETLRAE